MPTLIYNYKNRKRDEKKRLNGGINILQEEDLYSRHEGIEMKVPNEIFVLGNGGTGTWTTIWAAMMGVKIIHLADHDILENHNRSRLPYKEGDVGRLKTDLLKEFVLSIRPDCTVYTYDGIHTESDLLILTGEIVFDCNDNPEMQRMVFNYCKKQNLRYVGVGCNADHISVLENLNLVCGSEYVPYKVTPMFAIPPALASLCVLWNVIKGKQNINVLRLISSMLE